MTELVNRKSELGRLSIGEFQNCVTRKFNNIELHECLTKVETDVSCKWMVPFADAKICKLITAKMNAK
jgi:hypothetical protein